MFPRAVLEAAKAHAKSAYPLESCGLIVDERYIECVNEHETPAKHFRINQAVFDEVWEKQGPIRAVVHSHVHKPDYPSKLDMESQAAMGIPWGIVLVQSCYVCDPFWFGDDVPIAPLLEREFRWGVHDCYALVRDWYRLNHGILMPNFPREDEWWLNGQNMFEELYEEAGMVLIAGASLPEKRGDVIVGKIYSKVPNHCAVYEGNGLILHHLGNRLSERVPIEPWRKFIHKVFRHRKLL